MIFLTYSIARDDHDGDDEDQDVVVCGVAAMDGPPIGIKSPFAVKQESAMSYVNIRARVPVGDISFFLYLQLFLGGRTALLAHYDSYSKALSNIVLP